MVHQSITEVYLPKVEINVVFMAYVTLFHFSVRFQEQNI